MGEKKRRLAAGAPMRLPSERVLDERIDSYTRECTALEASVAANPSDHAALYRISSLRNLVSLMQRERGNEAALASVNLNQALGAISQAIDIAPHVDEYWIHFAECMRFAELRLPLHPRARDLLDRAFDHPAIAPSAFVNAIAGLARSHPAMQRITLGAITEIFDEPLLRKLLTLGVVADPVLESLIVTARRLVLSEIAASLTSSTALPIETLAAIAQQCFACEYVYDESPEETAQLDVLAHALDLQAAGALSNPSPAFHYWQVLHACYRPIYTLRNAASMAAVLSRAPQPLAELANRQFTEPALEQEIRATFSQGETLVDATSLAVGRLYEEHPYPRWIKCPASQNPLGFRRTIATFIPHVPLENLPDEDIDILIAGCGTGIHSIEAARRYPGARILAIDLSAASLAYAKRKTTELGITNVEYQRRDILSLGSLSNRFDLIESIGVLHHLREPLAGWRVLRGLQKPRGLMRVGLYSEIARRDITRLRAEVARRDFPPTLAGIRQCRAMIRPLLDERDPLTIARSPDFYCASGCRDLLFHVMEHCFNLPRVAQALDELALEFLGFMLPTPAIGERYRAQFPNDPSMTNIGHWEAFEQANPWIFKGLYNFWMRAKN